MRSFLVTFRSPCTHPHTKRSFSFQKRNSWPAHSGGPRCCRKDLFRPAGPAHERRSSDRSRRLTQTDTHNLLQMRCTYPTPTLRRSRLWQSFLLEASVGQARTQLHSLINLLQHEIPATGTCSVPDLFCNPTACRFL